MLNVSTRNFAVKFPFSIMKLRVYEHTRIEKMFVIEWEVLTH